MTDTVKMSLCMNKLSMGMLVARAGQMGKSVEKEKNGWFYKVIVSITYLFFWLFMI